MKVADLFSGGGCFSAAIQLLDPPPEVVLGVDNCTDALQCFMENHTGVRASGVTLPSSYRELQLPEAEAQLHCHFSPPCDSFSSSRRGRASPEEVELGTRLLAWSVEFAVQHRLPSFSVENVAVDAVKRQLQRLREKYPADFDFLELDSGRLGAASDRCRVFGGRPGMIARLRALRPKPLRTIATALVDAGLQWPADATHVRAASGVYRSANGTRFAMRCLETERAHTVVASRAMVFARADGSTVRQLAPCESAALMSLSNLKLPTKVASATTIVGMGIEGNTARVVAEAARAELANASDSPNTVVSVDRVAVDAAVLAAVEEHACWWRQSRHKRSLVLERAMAEGMSRTKVAQLLDELTGA